MTKTMHEALIAILVDKLGGEVRISDYDLRRADELTITTWRDEPGLFTKITTERPPEILQGEVVEPEQPAIAVKPHECEDWMIVHPVDSAPYCAGCGSHVA